jgi:hypothetical protein
MKKSRHKPRPKFINSHEPVGLADLYPDFFCDLQEPVAEDVDLAPAYAPAFAPDGNGNSWKQA